MTWRQSNNQWSGGIAAHPAPKYSKCKNLLEKSSCRFFGIKTAGRSPRGSYSSTTISPAHRALETQKKLAYLGFQCLDHPPYSPDLAPSDYHLFPGLKEQLKGHHFSSEVEVIAAAETWLDGQPFDFFFFFEWLAKVRARG